MNIFGAEDLRTPPSMLQELAGLNPFVQNLELAGAGHFPFLLPENRELITEAVTNFIN